MTCKHCRADRAIHRFDDFACPAAGKEARPGQVQRWLSTTYEEVDETPQLLLYDEPTAELDPILSATITEIIATLREHTAVTSLVVTHDRSLALSIADRVAIIMDGRIRAVGIPEDFKRTTDPAITDFLSPLIDLKHPRFKQLENDHE